MTRNKTPMFPLLEKAERLNSKLIIPSIVVLMIVIVYDLFFHTTYPAISLMIRILDSTVLVVFITDLFFLALKAKSTTFFLKNYWLDILAVFPFSLIFRVVSQFSEAISLTERVALSQTIVHEGLEVEREAAAISKGGKATRFLRVITKSHLFTDFAKKNKIAHERTFTKHSQ